MKKIGFDYKLVLIIGLILFSVFGPFIINHIHYTGFSIFADFFNSNLIVSVGRLLISINFNVYINSPQNITYNFSLNNSYPILLNVSSNRNISIFNYTLIDLTHNITLNQSVNFTSNTTIYASRWSNLLIVTGRDNAGNYIENSTYFYISVNGSAPIIHNISSIVYACEQDTFSYMFNVSDYDENSVSTNLVHSDSSSPFYVNLRSNYNNSVSTHELYSGILNKTHSGGLGNNSKNYSETIYANDGSYTDFKNINITVIATNNAPVLQSINNIGIWSSGEGSSFYYQLNASDIEDGNQNSGNLSFNISFSGQILFNISSNGTMIFSPNGNYLGSHNITVCVSESGLRNPHGNLSLCNQTGANASSCRNFLLSVSEKGVEISPSSSGGGGGGLSCIEKFGCEEWSECYFLDEAMYNTFDFNLTFSLKRNCSLSGWNTSVCGFQTRQCKQLNKCISNYSRTFIQSCYYSKNPSCYDEIKNCHDGSCEILTDCGGTCKPCPICHDGIMNQGETGIDCGGPCKSCPIEMPNKIRITIFYLFFFIVLLLIILIVFLLKNIQEKKY